MGYYEFRALLKHFVTMEVIRWVSFWGDYKSEFEQEAHLTGGSLGEQAAEDLRQRVIEHVSNLPISHKAIRQLTHAVIFWSMI